jgi:hypothetical protein
MADGQITGLPAGAEAADSTTTNDGSTVTVCSWAPPNADQVMRLVAIIWAVEIGTVANTYEKTIHTMATIGGAGPTIRGTPTTVSEDDAGAVGFAVIVDASGADIRVRATGVIATDIRWAAAIYAAVVEENHA